MSDADEKLTPADPADVVFALALALRQRKRARYADEITARIVAEHLFESLDAARFVVMQRPPVTGGAALGRGAKG